MSKLAQFARTLSTHAPVGNVADHVAALIGGQVKPVGKALPEVTTKIFSAHFQNSYQQFRRDLPYVSRVISTLHDENLTAPGFMTPHGQADSNRIDHGANRHFLDKRVSPLDKTGDFPEFSPYAGRVLTALPLAMLGMVPVGNEMSYPARAAKGQGYIRKGFESEHVVPRWFASDQDASLLPEESQRVLKAGLVKAEGAALTKEDWTLLRQVDAGLKIDDAACEHIAYHVLTKVFGLNHVVNPETTRYFREKEKQGDGTAVYTANAYENGQRINHYAVPVKDVAATSQLIRSMDIPTVKDQGLGTPLQQGAAESGKHLAFLEFIYREPVRGKDGKVELHPNGEPKVIENAFNENANGIFLATNQGGHVAKLASERAKAAEKSTGRS